MLDLQEPEPRAYAAEPISADRRQALIDVVLDELIEAFLPADERAAIARADRRARRSRW